VILSFLLEWMPAFAGAGAALLATWGLSWWAHRHETGRSAFRTAKPARLLSSPNEIAFAKAFQKEGSEAGASEEARSKLRPRENEYVPLPLLPYDTAKRNGAGVPPETGDATGGPASHLPASLNGAGLADSAGVSDGAGLGDADLADLIGKDQNVLLIGSPTAGKTRRVFEVLRRQVPDRVVIVPHQGDALRSGLTPEARQYLRRKAVVVVVDDLHKYAGRGDTLNLLLEQVAAAADSCAIVGTCRDGPELEIARGGHDGASVQGLHISEVYKRFYAHRYVIQRLTDEEIDRIAEAAGKDPSSVDRSDCATPGDILLQQSKQDMRARFEDRLSRGEQHVLHAGQLLDAGQVEPTRERIQWVVASLYDRPGSVATSGALQDALRQLEEMRFLSSTSPIVLEPAYTRLDVGPERIVAPYAPGRQVGEDLIALISLLSERSDAEGRVGLGIGLREREKTGEALECFSRAVDIDRSNVRVWFYRGVVLHDLGRPSEEIFDSFDRAVEADPSYAKAWYGQGFVLQELGRPDEARASYDRACELDPDLCD
jgi:tetratricopeptide (TPR) repeat protein